MNLEFLKPFSKKKQILGGGLSIGKQHARFALTEMAGTKLKVIKLFEIDTHGFEDPIGFKKKLKYLNLGSKAFAINVEEESLKIKNMTLPVMPEKDLSQAMYWNLTEEEGVESGLEIRSVPLSSKKTSRQREYQVYGIATQSVQRAKNWAEESGIKVLAGEPQAVALAAFYEWICPQQKQTVIFFHREEENVLTAAIHETQLIYSHSFRIDRWSASNPESEIPFEFQNEFERCLKEGRLSEVDEIILSGDFFENDAKAIGTALEIPCFLIREKINDQMIFEEEKQSEKIGQYAIAIGLSTHPSQIVA